MRLDKYLKVSRLIKRRTLAKEVSNNERILVNNKIAKASTTLNVNDIIEIHYGNRVTTVKVLDLKESTKKEDALTMFEILKEETIKIEL